MESVNCSGFQYILSRPNDANLTSLFVKHIWLNSRDIFLYYKAENNNTLVSEKASDKKKSSPGWPQKKNNQFS